MSLEADPKILALKNKVRRMHDLYRQNGKVHAVTINRKDFRRLLDRGLIKRYGDTYTWDGMRVQCG